MRGQHAVDLNLPACSPSHHSGIPTIRRRNLLAVDGSQLTINISATQILNVDTSQQLAKTVQPIASSLSITDEAPEQISSGSYFKLVFNETLFWDEHIPKLCKKVTAAVSQVGRVKHQLSPNTLTSCVRGMTPPLLPVLNNWMCSLCSKHGQ